jgi:hypothetical protein
MFNLFFFVFVVHGCNFERTAASHGSRFLLFLLFFAKRRTGSVFSSLEPGT